MAGCRSRLIEGTEVIQETYGKPRAPTEERCLPDRPAVGHHDIITDLALCRSTQTLIVTSSRDGMVKVWKWPNPVQILSPLLQVPICLQPWQKSADLTSTLYCYRDCNWCNCSYEMLWLYSLRVRQRCFSSLLYKMLSFYSLISKFGTRISRAWAPVFLPPFTSDWTLGS